MTRRKRRRYKTSEHKLYDIELAMTKEAQRLAKKRKTFYID